MQKKLKLQIFQVIICVMVLNVEFSYVQASEKVHFHTDTEMALVAEACPDIQKMIFKYNPEYFSSYLQVINFCFL